MRVETERLYLYPISNDEMHSMIEKENGVIGEESSRFVYRGKENE